MGSRFRPPVRSAESSTAQAMTGASGFPLGTGHAKLLGVSVLAPNQDTYASVFVALFRMASINRRVENARAWAENLDGTADAKDLRGALDELLASDDFRRFTHAALVSAQATSEAQTTMLAEDDQRRVDAFVAALGPPARADAEFAERMIGFIGGAIRRYRDRVGPAAAASSKPLTPDPDLDMLDAVYVLPTDLGRMVLDGLRAILVLFVVRSCAATGRQFDGWRATEIAAYWPKGISALVGIVSGLTGETAPKEMLPPGGAMTIADMVAKVLLRELMFSRWAGKARSSADGTYRPMITVPGE
jgi:hypothetical protein